MIMFRSKTIATILAALGATVSIALATGGANGAVGPKSPPAEFAPQPGSNADAGSVFSVLDRAPTQADRNNTPIVRFAEEEPWVRVAGARRAGTAAAGDVWLTPTTDGRVCLSVARDDYTGHTCDTVTRARTIGIVIEIAGRFVGIVPDGTSSAVLSHPNGVVETLRLSHGVFETQALRGMLTVRSPAGEYEIEI